MSGRPLSMGAQTELTRPSSIHLSSTSGSGPRKSHYRPFSTLYIQSPIVEIPTPPSLRRTASVGGMHQLRNTMGMGFQFASKGRKELVRANSSVVPRSLPSTKKTAIFDSFTAIPPSSFSSPDELPIIDICQKRVSFGDVDDSNIFVPKNIWAKRCNMPLHPYHNQVAYMQAYDSVSLESDRYTDLLLQRLTNGSPSFHDYGSKPPTMVLDLGCGQGHWILHAANLWKDTEFVGLDIVDITLPAFETTENVSLVRGDFLNYKLPFPDNTFDFVRMANLALCIPYDQWEFVLSQVQRVLAPLGRLELIDDDIYFPYGEDWKVELASPLTGSLFGDERSEAGVSRQDEEDTDNPDTNTESPINVSTPTSSGLLSRSGSVRTHNVLRRKSSVIPRDSNATPTPDLKPTISPRPRPPTPGHLRQSSSSSSASLQTNAPPWSTMRGGKSGKPSPPCPKPTREKVAPLPTIRSTAPTRSLSSRTRYSPTWSQRTDDTSPTSSDASSFRTADTSPTASMCSVVNIADWKNILWQRKAFASKNMESLFEKMLIEQYGINPRPAEFLLRVLGQVFHKDGSDGAGEARFRMKRFHIKLGPTGDSDHLERKGRGRSSMDEADCMTSMSTKSSTNLGPIESEKQNGASVSTPRSRFWETLEGQDKGSKGSSPQGMIDKKNQSKLDERGKQSKLKKRQAGAVNTVATMPVSLLKKPRPLDPSLSTPARAALSAKAASVLGIPYSELSAEASPSSHKTRTSGKSKSAPCPSSFNLSLKAAARLGITYSEALSAAASLSVPRGVSHSTKPSSPITTSSPSNTTSGPVQHTGLLVWPNTFIPMTAGELEMHACKHIHTLLGCRPALEEFVSKFVDRRGVRMIEDEEFRDEIWEYECFRRERFNWPSEVAEPYEDEPKSPNPVDPLPVTTANSTGGGHGINVDANQTLDPAVTMTGSVSANAPLQTVSSHSATDHFAGFSEEKFLRPTKSSLVLRSAFVRRSQVNSKFIEEFETSPVRSPAPSCSKPRGHKALPDLVHLRSIRVFEAVKTA